MGFTEPSRSPGLLVSSYLAVSPLPRPRCKHPGRGGLFSVALSLSGAAVKQPKTVGVTHHRALWSPDFPPRHVLRRELWERFPALRAHIAAPRRSSRPPRTSLYTVRRNSASGNPTTPVTCAAAPHRSSRRALVEMLRHLGSCSALCRANTSPKRQRGIPLNLYFGRALVETRRSTIRKTARCRPCED